jgi:predicted phage terminase large subunit-like protein
VQVLLAKRRELTTSDVTLEQFVESTVNFSLHSWQRDHLCPLLQRLRNEKGLRIAIHGPPQYGKSVITSQRLPAYLIGCNPLIRIGLACYNETHATNFGDVIKGVICSEDYKAFFPAVDVRKDAPAGKFSTQQRLRAADAQPSFLAMGLQSGFTGKGVDTLIIDDPYKSADEARSEAINEKVWRWWSQTANVRLGEEANVIVMFHRYHEDDFAGRLLANGGWEYVRFPAIADTNEDGSDPTGRQPGELLSPMRSQEWLKAQEEDDPQTFLGQFQGKPRPDEGALFHKDWLQIISPDQVPLMDLRVRYWDLAVSEKSTADYTAGALCGFDSDGTFYVLDINRFRANWPAAAEIIGETALHEFTTKREGSSYHVAADARATQLGFVQDLMTKGIFGKVPLWPDTSKGDKVQRASAWAARAKAGKVRLVRGAWNGTFINECIGFPLGKHDDQVDAVSGAFEQLWRLKGGHAEHEKTIQPGTHEFYRKLGQQHGVGRR